MEKRNHLYNVIHHNVIHTTYIHKNHGENIFTKLRDVLIAKTETESSRRPMTFHFKRFLMYEELK